MISILERPKKYLSKQLPVFEMIREWYGGQAAVGKFDQVLALKSEVERLRKLVESTAKRMRESGHSSKLSNKEFKKEVNI